MKKIALMLDENSKNKLLLSFRNLIPEGWIQQGDLMIIKQDDNLNVNGIDFSHILNKRYEILSMGFGLNKLACCARIVPPTELLHLRLNSKQEGEPYFPYVVLALNRSLDGKLSDAESIDKFTGADSLVLAGTVEVVDG